MTTTTTSSEFGDQVRAMLAEQPTSGVIDRFAANDLLLDLLDAARSDAEQGRVMQALADLPKTTWSTAATSTPCWPSWPAAKTKQTG